MACVFAATHTNFGTFNANGQTTKLVATIRLKTDMFKFVGSFSEIPCRFWGYKRRISRIVISGST